MRFSAVGLPWARVGAPGCEVADVTDVCDWVARDMRHAVAQLDS